MHLSGMRALIKSIIIPTFLYAIFRWDYHLSSYAFEDLCEEEVGVFIYESIVVDPHNLRKFKSIEERNRTDPWLIVNGYALDKDYLEKTYVLKKYEIRESSSIGPISLLRTSITRKSDGTLLGEVVTGSNGQGWLAQKLGVSFGGGGVNCPMGSTVESKHVYFKELHWSILSKIFIAPST